MLHEVIDDGPRILADMTPLEVVRDHGTLVGATLGWDRDIWRVFGPLGPTPVFDDFPTVLPRQPDRRHRLSRPSRCCTTGWAAPRPGPQGEAGGQLPLRLPDQGACAGTARSGRPTSRRWRWSRRPTPRNAAGSAARRSTPPTSRSASPRPPGGGCRSRLPASAALQPRAPRPDLPARDRQVPRRPALPPPPRRQDRPCRRPPRRVTIPRAQPASRSASRRPSCTAVSVGLAWPEVGSTAVETTKRFGSVEGRGSRRRPPRSAGRPPCGSCRPGGCRAWPRRAPPRPGPPAACRQLEPAEPVAARARPRARRGRAAPPRRPPREKRRSIRSRGSPSRSVALRERQPALRVAAAARRGTRARSAGRGCAGRTPAAASSPPGSSRGRRARSRGCAAGRGATLREMRAAPVRRRRRHASAGSARRSAAARAAPTESARKTADSGPERCAGSAIGGTTGQKATLASRASRLRRRRTGTSRRRT